MCSVKTALDPNDTQNLLEKFRRFMHGEIVFLGSLKITFFWLYFHLNKVAIACIYVFDFSLFAIQVLSSHPNYPKIKKDILDKARSSIRIWSALLYQFLLVTLFYVPGVTVQFTGRLLYWKVICVWWFSLDIGSDILICLLYQPSTICLTEPGIATKWSML